jgi:hypothetical protein
LCTWPHVVLQRSELGDDVRRNDVGTCREQLPELHERRAELVEQLTQVLPARRRSFFIRRCEPRLRGPARQQVGELVRLEEVAEAVAHHHLRDLGQAAERACRRLGHVA